MRFGEDRPLPLTVSLTKFLTSLCTCFLSCKTKNVIHLHQEAIVGNRCQELFECKEGRICVHLHKPKDVVEEIWLVKWQNWLGGEQVNLSKSCTFPGSQFLQQSNAGKCFSMLSDYLLLRKK